MGGGDPIRLIDAGVVSHLRSQALYHGLAHARSDETPDTVVLATPGEAHICIGYHQDAASELDLEHVARLGLPVLRREAGGGAVYLDQDQLFVQWVMAPERLPARVERRFELFCAPLVATYRALGVEACFRPANDVHVEDRKIAGTGAARIGAAEVLIGNLLFDFDVERMASLVRAPSPAYRDLVLESLRRYMSSLRRELGSAPAPREVAQRYARACAEALGRELSAGELTPQELAAVERAERELTRDALEARPAPMRRAGLKIHADVYVVEALVPDAQAALRVTARLVEGRVEAVRIRAADDPLACTQPALEQSLLGAEWQTALDRLVEPTTGASHDRRS